MTPLKIGSDCQPKSLKDKLSLQLASKAEEKKFWLSQSYAVKRSHQVNLENSATDQRAFKISESAEAAAKAVERRSEDAYDALYGASADQRRLTLEARRQEDQDRNAGNRLMAQLQAERDAASFQWMLRCSKYAEEKSK